MLQASASAASSAVRSEENEHDIFGKLVATKIQKYSPYVRSIVQEEAMKIMFKADRGWYNVNNQQFPPSQVFSPSHTPTHQQSQQPGHYIYNANSSSFHPNPSNTNTSLPQSTGQTTPPATTPTPQTSPVSHYYSSFLLNTSEISNSAASSNTERLEIL